MKLLVLALLTAGFGFAQNKPVNDQLAAFWTSFQTAVVKGDAESVASMTKLPFLIDRKDYDRAKFVKVFPELFPAKAKKCFATAKPVKENDGFDIFCGERMFVFERSGGTYKFVMIGAND